VCVCVGVGGYLKEAAEDAVTVWVVGCDTPLQPGWRPSRQAQL
jgi:hypothetical protein